MSDEFKSIDDWVTKVLNSQNVPKVSRIEWKGDTFYAYDKDDAVVVYGIREFYNHLMNL